MFYGLSKPLLAQREKAHSRNGSEFSRCGRSSAGGLIEGLAPFVDLPVTIQLSHVDDSRGY
jgi:hypothetical protein